MPDRIADLLNSSDWKDRFRGEYQFVKDKYNKLHEMIVKYKAGKLDFEPNCSIELLKEQASAMGSYLFILEARGQIEGVDLNEF